QALTLAVAGNVEFFLKDQIISLTNSLGAFFGLQKSTDTLQNVVKSTLCTASVCSITTLKNDLQTFDAPFGVVAPEKGAARIGA
uniref:hypothetical protein n=1 Tax=uncultured Maritalea sp. TaxID=757249 RepID=UPI00260A5D4C